MDRYKKKQTLKVGLVKMTNTNAANGFRIIQNAFGRGGMNSQSTKYWSVGSTILGVGDPVVRVTGSASSDPNGVGALIQRATTGAYVTGHIVGFDPNTNNLAQVGYAPSGYSGYVYVADDPEQLLVVQEGGSGTALSTQNIGQSINAITAVNASTTLGTSLYQIDNATVTTASTGTYILMQLLQRADNAVGQYAKWLVKVNLSTEAVSGASNVLAI